MRRFAPLIVSLLGILLIALSVSNILPNFVGAGVALIIFGLIVFGLNFIPRPEGVSDTPPMNDAQRLTGIFFSPADTFRNLRRHPRWLVALLVMSIAASAYDLTFIQRVTPETIANFTTQKTEEMGFNIPPDQMKKIREDNLKQVKEPTALAASTLANFVGLFFFIALTAAIYFLIVLVMGGQINFWQAFAATVFSWLPVVVITKVLSFIILFLKDPSDVHPVLGRQTLVTDNLGVLFTPAASPVLFTLASAIGVLSLYGLWLAATGLKNAGERVSGAAAWTAALTVWFLGIALLVILAAVAPGFIS